MYRLKKLLRSYLSFSRKELNGIFVLFVLILLVILTPRLYSLFFKDQKYDFERFKMEAEDFRAAATNIEIPQGKINKEADKSWARPVYFNFDPNGLSESNWLKLGLSHKQIQVIRNYELKGGKFFRKEDLKKIYSISEKQYSMLEPFIKIGNIDVLSGKMTVKTNYKSTGIPKNTLRPIIELNVADSLELESIRGIGPAFASRIIKFRRRIGGFYRKEQLLEIYGMDSLKYDQLKDQIQVNAGLITRININTFTFEEIRHHPYLNYKQMNAIIQYRAQHGSYKSVDDLRKIAILNEEIIRKIEPYFSLSP
jgi:DNA uptake protein ComE-like DNA-binding protein